MLYLISPPKLEGIYLGYTIFPPKFFWPRRLIFVSLVEFGTPVSNLLCFLKSIERLQSYSHLNIWKPVLGAGFKKEVLKLKKYKIRQGQNFLDFNGFWCSRCLNDHIDLSYMMEGSRTFCRWNRCHLVAKIWTKRAKINTIGRILMFKVSKRPYWSLLDDGMI